MCLSVFLDSAATHFKLHVQIKSTLTPQSTVVSHRRSTHERAHHNTTSRSYTRESSTLVRYARLSLGTGRQLVVRFDKVHLVGGGDGGDSGAANYVRKRDAPPSG